MTILDDKGTKGARTKSTRRRLYDMPVDEQPSSSQLGAKQTVQDEPNDAPVEEVHNEGALRRGAADNTIRHYCYWSFSAALIPVPIVDFAAMSAIQLKMISELCALYEVPFSQERALTTVSTLLASASSSTFVSLAKLVPGLGYFGVAIPLAGINVSYTYAVGKIFAQHFQSGEPLESFDPAEQKSRFAEKLREGREYAKRTKEDFKSRFRTEKTEA
ncbi:MAG: DUF697 domain-containing protein [Gammaproteobacteria bacterium]|nr:DUF697 domain-containing protein [Gammaproteobacteria bacterium]